MTKARSERAIPVEESEEWDMEDHLVAMSACVGPLQGKSTDILDALIRCHNVLWPGETFSDNYK
jgi:hypothetical protein